MAIELGTIEQWNKGYMILSYIDGDDAEERIGNYPENIQYQIGFEAGVELRKIHKLKVPSNTSNWYERKSIKHKRYMEQYIECGYKLKHDDKIMDFIDQNIDLMRNRPNLFQHDDFHVGNIIVKDQGLSGIIDFNRYDWGDPVHDFLKAGFFSSECSVPFSIGQIRGYHQNQDPDDAFWRLYSLYVAMCIFSR